MDHNQSGCQSESKYDENGNERVIRKRKRKSGEQLKALVREFDRNPNWAGTKKERSTVLKQQL